MLFKEYEKVPVLCKSMAWVQVPFSAGDTQQLQCLTVHPAWGLWWPELWGNVEIIAILPTDSV